MSDGCKEFMIMYFEEKMIDGVMCFRTRPDGEWREYSIQDLSRRYAEVKSALSDDGWTYCDDRLPERKEGWEHTDEVLVWYEGGERKMAKYGIAYYHYRPPYRDPEWVDFANLGRVPIAWRPLPAPTKGREG